MNKYFAGFVAGFVATVVLSLLMIVKSMMGLMPELDVITMLSRMMGMPAIMGWIAHFAIGTIAWGGLFALIQDRLPGNTLWLRGVVFGIGVWLMMMIAVMPMAGAGLFGMALGIMAPMATLILHIIFGAILGGTYSVLGVDAPRPRPSH